MTVIPRWEARLPPALTVVDGGARGGLRELRALHERIDLHAFEPDPAACRSLATLAGYRSVHPVPSALSSRAGRCVLHVARKPSMSSLLEPDVDAYRRHFGRMADFPSWVRAIETVADVEVDATTLDAWSDDADRPLVHYLKLDTQGTELDVLRGARALLADARVCVIRSEVAFLPVYRAQALFPDVTRYLAEEGYTLLDCRFYPDAMGAPRWPSGRYVEPPRWAAGGDATFVCAPGRWPDAVRAERAVAVALILSQLGYGRTAERWLTREAGWTASDADAALTAWTRPSRRDRLAGLVRRWLPPALTRR